MLRTMLSLIAAAALGGSAFAAEYADPDSTFRFTMPDGWQEQTMPITGINLFIVSPRIALTAGNCNFITTDHPELKSRSQAEVEAMGQGVFNDAFWKTALEGAQLQNVAIEKSGSRNQHDRKVFFVRTTSDATIEGSTIHIAQWQDAHLTPGRFYVVTCTAVASALSQEEDDFNTIMTSFEPILDTPTAMLRSRERPTLTLYEHAGFAGVSRVITQDTSDLTHFGWSRAAGSFSLAGPGTWEVCDRADFTGHCRTLAGNAGALPAFAAVSARHMSARPADLNLTLQNALRASIAPIRVH